MAQSYLATICLALMAGSCLSADPTFPDIKKLTENGFMSKVEISGQPENSTVSVEEFYDKSNKLTKINILRQGNQQTLILYEKTGQMAKIEKNSCQVRKAVDTDDFLNPLFQKWLYSEEGESSEVYYGPTSLLRRAYDSPPEYTGITKVRGMNCHTFKSKDPDNEGSFIDYYFTADWTTPVSVSKNVLLPVQIRLYGEGEPMKGSEDESYVQYVDFVYFVPSVRDPRVFELPTGVGCKGLITEGKPIPSITDRFSLTGEQFNALDNSEAMAVNTFRVWYDLPVKLARFDLFTKDDSGVSKVLDYNTGLMYVTTNNKECIALPISDSYFDTVSDDLKIVLKDPKGVMGLKGDFYYLGKKFTRGIYCDVWERVDENATIDGAVLDRIVYTYYFSSHWWEMNVDGEVEERVPIRLEVSSYFETNEPASSKTVFNFFLFREHPPMGYGQFNIENCEDGVPDKSYIGIIMETDIEDATKAESKAEEVRVWMQTEIVRVAGISPIRLPFVRVDFEPTAITVMALILERAPAIRQFVKGEGEGDTPGSKEINKGNFKNSEQCAEECIKEEICTGFHYCGGKGECYISLMDLTSDWGDKVQSAKSCELYIRHEAGSKIKDLLLKDALDNLEKAVNSKNFFIELQVGTDGVKFTASDFIRDVSPVTTGDHDKDMFSTVVRQKKFTKVQTTRSGGGAVTSSDCYRKCKKEENIACSSFSFCSDTNECLLSSTLLLPGKEAVAELETDHMCNVYSVAYIQMFEQFKGQVRMSPGKDAISANSPDECAKSCREKTDPMCRGFDFCTSKKKCVLYDKHILDIKGKDLTSVGSGCSHYALKFSADYVEMGRLVLLDSKSRKFSQLSMEECAKLCSENLEFKCPSFDYCASDEPMNRQCTLNTLSLTDDVKTEDSDTCQHYSKKNVVDEFLIDTNSKRVKQPEATPDTGGYTPSGLAGVIIGVLIFGIAIGIIGFLIMSYRKSRSMDGTSSVRFVKQDA